MIRNRILSMLVISAMLAAAGSQVTPEPEQSKAASNEQAYLYTPEDKVQLPINQPNFPENFKLELELDAVSVYINSDVIVPSSDTFPIFQTSIGEFSPEVVKLLTDTLFPETKLSAIDPDAPETKKEIAAEILRNKKYLSDPDSNLYTAELPPEEIARISREVESAIAKLEKEYPNAPDSYIVKELELTQDSMKNALLGNVIDKDSQMVVDGKDGQIAMAGILLRGKEALPKAPPLLQVTWTAAYFEANSKNAADSYELCMTKEEAEAIAEASKAKIPLAKNMEINQIYRYGLSWEVVYTSVYNNIPVSFAQAEYSSAASKSDSDVLAGQECLVFSIDDKGIREINWTAPAKIETTLKHDVQLMEFSEVTKLAEEHFKQKSDWIDPIFGIVSREIYITEIRLGYLNIVQKGTENQVLVPVWDFYGYSVDTYSEQQPGGYPLDENNQHVNQELGANSFLTLNAIDGSVINRNSSY